VHGHKPAVACRIVLDVSVVLLVDFVDNRQPYCLRFLLAHNNRSPFEAVVLVDIVDLELSSQLFLYPLFTVDVIIDLCRDEEPKLSAHILTLTYKVSMRVICSLYMRVTYGVRPKRSRWGPICRSRLPSAASIRSFLYRNQMLRSSPRAIVQAFRVRYHESFDPTIGGREVRIWPRKP
jgi:hypothetical protein